MISNRFVILFLITVAVFVKIQAQDITPCAEPLNTEIRATGIGHGETAFEALTNAVNKAMSKVKANVETMFPGKNFEYSFLSKSSSEGEQVELETTLGQPSICKEDIECEETQCTVTLVLNFDISDWQKEQEFNINE